MVNFIRSDLEFILQQILIAERNAAGMSLLDLLPNMQVPFGLRTVDGSYNNLVFNENLGHRSDLLRRSRHRLPAYADADFSVADSVPANFFGPGQPGDTADLLRAD